MNQKKQVSYKSLSEILDIKTKAKSLKSVVDSPLKNTEKSSFKDQGLMFDLGLVDNIKGNYLLYVAKMLDKPPTRVEQLQLDKLVMLGVLALVYFWWVGQWIIGLIMFLFATLYYLFIKIKPSSVIFSIESQGVRIEDEFFGWESLKGFWVAEQGGYYVIYITTNLKFPTLLAVVTNRKQVVEEITLVLGQFLPYKTDLEQGILQRFSMGNYLQLSDIIDTASLIEDKDTIKQQVLAIIKRSLANADRILSNTRSRVSK